MRPIDADALMERLNRKKLAQPTSDIQRGLTTALCEPDQWYIQCLLSKRRKRATRPADRREKKND